MVAAGVAPDTIATMTTPRPASTSFLSTGLLMLAAGCTGSGSDSSGDQLPFCETFDDADTSHVEDGGGSGASGAVMGNVVTNESDDIHDPNLVSFVEYTMDYLDHGGALQSNQTDQEGYFHEVLGEGRWLMKLSAQKPGYDCSNELEFEVDAGNTTRLCVDVGCI